MVWFWFSKKTTETIVTAISDLSGAVTVSVDGPEVSVVAALSPTDLLTDVASPVTPSVSSAVPVLSRQRPCIPHVAFVPVALVTCLPWRPFFRSSASVASPEPVAVASPVASPEPVAVASPEPAPVPVPDSLQIRSTAPVDTLKGPESVKEPAPSVLPLQA